MDVAHLVSTVGRLARTPALHFAVLGTLLFAGSLARQAAAPERERIVVARHRIDGARSEFERMMGRPATPEEARTIENAIADQEVLYAYALELGLDREPVAERRLAQIARFVAENPHEGKSERDLALNAIELGLAQEDLVARRVLIDGARRLIRAGALMREPDDEMLLEYLTAHPDEFRTAQQTRISCVILKAAPDANGAQAAARKVLGELRSGARSPEQVAEAIDAGLVPSSPDLPLLSPLDLERRLGRRLTEQLAKLPLGSWQGPFPVRDGLALVYVHERVPGQVPELEDARLQVLARLRQKLADDWLALRLQELRHHFDVVVQPRASG